jgi:hypothetical protein
VPARKTFHYRDPANTPSLQAVFHAIYRRPDDVRPGLTAVEIEAAARAQGHPSVRASSDVSELRAWARDTLNDRARPFYYVPRAEFIRTTESGNVVHRFVIYRYNDPRAVAAREREETKALSRAA